MQDVEAIASSEPSPSNWDQDQAAPMIFEEVSHSKISLSKCLQKALGYFKVLLPKTYLIEHIKEQE